MKSFGKYFGKKTLGFSEISLNFNLPIIAMCVIVKLHNHELLIMYLQYMIRGCNNPLVQARHQGFTYDVQLLAQHIKCMYSCCYNLLQPEVIIFQSIVQSKLLSINFHICLLNIVEFLLLSCWNEVRQLLYLVLKFVAVKPISVLCLWLLVAFTVALQIRLDFRHSPFSRHLCLSWQLHSQMLLFSGVLYNSLLLRRLIIDLILGIQL